MTLLRNYLRRYTDLPSLIHLLRSRTITFLDPSSWDDKNDAYFMGLYKEQRELTSLLAICCSMQSETYHHWRVFSQGSAGVCVSFDRSALVKVLSEGSSAVRCGPVKYLKLDESRKKGSHRRDMLPFLKHFPFGDEREFRFIWESKTQRVRSKDVRIPLSCIDRIYLSPWMPESVAESVRQTLKEIKGVEDLRITRSTLIRNDQWQAYGDRIIAGEMASRRQPR